MRTIGDEPAYGLGGSIMPNSTLEQRVAALEEQVARLLGTQGATFATSGLRPPYTIDAMQEKEFEELAERWRRERGPTSSPMEMVMKPSYLRIIGLGKPAVPLLLRELHKRPDHWFWALISITGENPVAPEHSGDLKKMAEDWLAWGREHSYIVNDAR
jgi:hypothetical protein